MRVDFWGRLAPPPKILCVFFLLLAQQKKNLVFGLRKQQKPGCFIGWLGPPNKTYKTPSSAKL
jgi:hypothetical protein